MKLIDVPYPETNAEREIRKELRLLQEEYEARAKPLKDKLVKIYESRPPRFVVMLDEVEQQRAAAFLPDYLPRT